MGARVAGIFTMIAALPGLAGGQAPPSTPPAVPRPPALAGPRLLSWTADPVECGGTRPAFARAPAPFPVQVWGAAQQEQPASYAFRIDASGRPLGIRRVPTAWVPFADDLAPALAVSRFAPGQARAGCTIRFSARRRPMAQAPVEEVTFYSLFPNGPVDPAVWARIWPAGNSCADPAPAMLRRDWPDFKRLPGTPGYPEWSMVGFDIDAGGRSRRVRTIAGTGDPALDAAAVKAQKASRFEVGAHGGCIYPYVRAAATLAPPAPPSEASMRPRGATCPEHLAWDREPALTFPEPFRRRGVEGWAVVAYDVAPWGQIGNTRVLAAEPASDFGEWALNVVGGATKGGSTTGYVGCVDRVIFRIGRPARVQTDDPVRVSID